MPIFMDRHYLRDMTPEHVAEAHRKDLGIQESSGSSTSPTGTNSERCTGFCLVDAPDAATAEHAIVKRMARLPRRSFRWTSRRLSVHGRSATPGKPRTPPRETGMRARAILVTDIVGSTELTTRLGDVAALELVRVHDALVPRGLARMAAARSSTPATASSQCSMRWRMRSLPPPNLRRFWAYNAEATEISGFGSGRRRRAGG